MSVTYLGNRNTEIKADFLAWRVMTAKRRRATTARNKAYNMRPRLRDTSHQ